MNQNRKKQNVKKEMMCFCNQIPVEDVQKAIADGCHTLNDIYDKTSAGVGACGGSCRRKIAPMLEEYLKTHIPVASKK